MVMAVLSLRVNGTEFELKGVKRRGGPVARERAVAAYRTTTGRGMDRIMFMV
jgi:hypothetical protein